MISEVLLDKIFSELPQRIVDNIMKATGENANFIGADGVIIASGDKSRIGSVHEGAKRIIDGKCNEIAITKEMETTMTGVKAGYNGAIVYDGQRIGVIGISGDPDLVKPVQKMAAITAHDGIQRLVERDKELTVVETMKSDIRDVAAQMQIISINGSIQAAKFGQKGEVFKIIVTEMRSLADKINKIIATN